jgi:hypothetical protein
MTHEIKFVPSGRGKARCEPNPAYPTGIALDQSTPGKKACLVVLPYPAPECGLWVVECRNCAVLAAITAAGRPDDPVSVKLRCFVGTTVQ